MTELAAFIFAFIKAIPAARDIFVKVTDLYFAAMDAADEDRVAKVQKERTATLAALKQPGLSDSDRAVLRRRLWELGKL